MRTLLGSVAPKITIASMKSWPANEQEYRILEGRTYGNELVHEDVPELAAREKVQAEDAGGAIGRELDTGQHGGGHSGLDGEQLLTVLEVDQEACDVSAQELCNDVPALAQI
jgi:hypothetical protein